MACPIQAARSVACASGCVQHGMPNSGCAQRGMRIRLRAAWHAHQAASNMTCASGCAHHGMRIRLHPTWLAFQVGVGHDKERQAAGPEAASAPQNGLTLNSSAAPAAPQTRLPNSEAGSQWEQQQGLQQGQQTQQQQQQQQQVQPRPEPPGAHIPAAGLGGKPLDKRPMPLHIDNLCLFLCYQSRWVMVLLCYYWSRWVWCSCATSPGGFGAVVLLLVQVGTAVRHHLHRTVQLLCFYSCGSCAVSPGGRSCEQPPDRGMLQLPYLGRVDLTKHACALCLWAHGLVFACARAHLPTFSFCQLSHARRARSPGCPPGC